MTQDPTLILEIISEKNKVSMSLYEHGSTVHQYEDAPISFQEIHNLCDEITGLLNKANEKGKLVSGISSELKKVGQVLYDQLLTNNVKHKLKNTRIDNLLILIDEGLVQIPWELLYDGDQFLCLRFNMGRNVKTRQALRESGQRAIGSPVKMLILSDPTSDLKSARQEASLIEKELDKKRNIINVAKKVTNIDIQYIKRNLRDYDIVHFAGHADYDFKDPSNSGWRLMDGRLPAKDIVNMGTTAPLPSIVFSNACQSAQTTEWLVDKDFENKIFGLANAFLLSGVRHYIGTFWKIPDDISLSFAKEFYRQIIQRKSIGESIRYARLEIIKDFGEDTIVWASYVLYGDPAINLFFDPISKKARKEIIFQKQIIILLIIFGSIIGTGILGFILYRNYFLRPELQEKMAWVPKNILAVMPFENLTGDKNIDWMAGGIADVIAMKLGRLEKINVIDRTQVENIWKEIKKSENIDKESALKIAGMVGADRVIMGAFQKIEDNVRVTVRLINVLDGTVIGTTDATNKYSNLFTLEDSIALNITDKLNIKITDAERIELKKFTPTNNINAFEFVTKATNAFISKDIKGAIEYCKKALEIDPSYIQANLALGYFYEWSGNLESARTYYKKAIELSETSKDKNLLLAANFNLGKLLTRIGQIPEGLELQNKALNIAKSLNDQQNYASILYSLGISYIMDSEFDKAKNAILESKSIFEKLKNNFGLATSYMGLGMYYSFGKEIDLEKAKQNLEEALRICEMLNAKEGLADVYSFLGGYYYTKQDLDEAIVYHTKSLKISTEISNKFSEATAYDGLGRAYEAKGEFGTAQEYYEKNLNLSKEVGNRLGIKNALYSLASLYLRQLRNDEALQYINLLIEEAKNDKDDKNQILGLRMAGNIYYAMGRYKEAIEKYNETTTIEGTLGDKYSLIEIYLGLAKCNGQLGTVGDRDKYFNLALQEAKNIQQIVSIAYVYSNIAQSHENAGELTRAIEGYKQVAEYAEKAKLDVTSRSVANTMLESAYYGLAECYKKQDNKTLAIEFYKKALPIAEERKSPLLNSIKSNIFFADKEKEEKKEEIKNKEAEALYKQASALYFNGEREKALEMLKEAYRKEPTSDKIMSLLCLIYEDLGRFDDAIAAHLDYTKYLDEKEDILKIIDQYSLIGDEYYYTGRLSQSKEYYDRALLLAKESGNSESLGQVYADYSMVWAALNQDDKAIEFATKGIELCKDTSKVYSLANAYQVLSNSYSKQNNREKALEYAQLSLKVDEESSSVHLGKSYALVGSSYKDIDIIKSLEYFNKAVGFFEKHNDLQSLGNVYHEIGSVYEKTQQIDKALEYFNKSLEISEKRNDKWTTLANYLGLEGAYYKNNNYKLSEEFRNKYIAVSKELGREEELGLMYAAFGHRYEDADKNEAEKFLLLSSNMLEKFRSGESLKSLFFNYYTLGHMYYEKKDFDKAMDYYQKAIDIAEKEDIKDRDILGLAYKSLGDCTRIKGNFAKTLEVYKKAKSIFSGTDGGKKLADSLDSEINKIEYVISNMDKVKSYDDLVSKATSYHKDHEWELALEHYKKALIIAREIKDSGKDEWIIKDMSEREKWLNNEITSIESYLKEVEISKKAKPAEILAANAILYMRQDKYDAALENLKKALKLYEEADYKKNIGLTKLQVGCVYLTKNDFKNAETMFNESMDIYKNIDDKQSVGLMHGAFGLLFEKRGKYDKAEAEYNTAIGLLEAGPNVKTYIVAYNNCLGSVYYKKRDYGKSLESYQKALEAGKDTEDPNSICLTYLMMAYINFINNSFKEASYSADSVLAIAESVDDKESVCIISLIKGNIFIKQNNYAKAKEFFNKAADYANLVDKGRLKLVSHLNLAIIAKNEGDKTEYDRWFSVIKEEGGLDYFIRGEIASDKAEALFKEIIEEKDYFKRIWF